MQAEPAVLPSYRDLLAVAGLRRLAATMLSARLGGNMYQLALVLFVLERFHSPFLAGVTTFFGWVPGLLASPIAGALLDRHGRVRLIALDLWVAVATPVAIALLAFAGWLTPPLLVVVVALSALTLPLTMTGTRSLMPLLLPRDHWDRANAVDSAIANLATVAGPALAGALAALIGSLSTLLVVAGIWLFGAVLVVGISEPPRATVAGHTRVMAEAWRGLTYLLRNRVLRGLAIAFPLLNASEGVLYVALPVFVLSLLHGSSAQVGALFSSFGVAALATGLLFGRVSTQARERRIMLGGIVVSALGITLVAVSSNLVLVFAGLLIAGAATGPLDVAMFSLRQRATDPAWFGRSLSISMSVNALGLPIGSLFAGALVGLSVTGSIAVSAALIVLGGAACLVLLPARLAAPSA
jgi:MFS family permease